MLTFLWVLFFVLTMVFTVRWFRRWAFKHLEGIEVQVDGDFWGVVLCAPLCILFMFCSIL